MWCSKRRRRSRRRLQRRLGLLQVVSVQPCAAWKSELPYFSLQYILVYYLYTRDLIDRSLTFEYIYILASELLRVTSLSRAETSTILFSLFDN